MPDTHARYDHSGFDSDGGTHGAPAPSRRLSRRGVAGPSPRRCKASAAGLTATARRFLRDARAVATGIAAVAVTVIAVSATAFVADSKWLVDQRDVLKSASNAAGIAATLELTRQLDANPGISDADLSAILEPIARRYILLNLRHLDADRYARAERTLVVQVVVNRHQRTVDVSAASELGGTFLSRMLPFMAESVVGEQMQVESLIETVTDPIEVVLAIDVSDSMKFVLDADRWAPSAGQLQFMVELGVISEEERAFLSLTRMDIVKMAAANLVDILGPSEDDRIAIGVVPWSNVVRLDTQARGRWEHNGWARYPTGRVYGAPYLCKPVNQCADPPPVTQNVASSPPEAWMGCLDEPRTGSVGTFAQLPADDELLWPPTLSAFAQNYFPAWRGYAYECTATVPGNMAEQNCYGPSTTSRTFGNKPSQSGCKGVINVIEMPPMQALSTDRAVVDQAIGALEPMGSGTYSMLGVLWAQRLLEHSWKDVWEGTGHPVDPQDPDNAGLRKAIVLLTDGENTYCGKANPACDNNRDLAVPSQVACGLAKARGSEIFVVAGVAPTFISQDFADQLRACSSESDNPDGTYVFIDNATPEALVASFAEIANQLRTVRRVY